MSSSNYKEFCRFQDESQRKQFIDSIFEKANVKAIDLVEECKSDLISIDEDQRSVAIQFVCACVSSGKIKDASAECFLYRFLAQKIPELLVLSSIFDALCFLLRTNDELETGNLIEILSNNFNVQSEKQPLRKQILDLLFAWISHSNSQEFNDESLLQVLEMFEGEKDPRNLTVSFRILAKLPEKWPEVCAKNASSFLDASFCYFPITFKPPANDPFGISPEQLKELLAKCLVASEETLQFLVPLLLEKLSSDSLVAKRDSWNVLAHALTKFHCQEMHDYFERLLEMLHSDSCIQELESCCVDVGEKLILKFGFHKFLSQFNQNCILFGCFAVQEEAFFHAFKCCLKEGNFVNLNALLKRKGKYLESPQNATELITMLRESLLERIKNPTFANDQEVAFLQSISLSLEFFTLEDLELILPWICDCFSHRCFHLQQQQQQNELIQIAIVQGIFLPLFSRTPSSFCLKHLESLLLECQFDLKCFSKLAEANSAFSLRVLSLLLEGKNTKNLASLIPACIGHSSKPIDDLTMLLQDNLLQEEQFLQLAPSLGWKWNLTTGSECFGKISKYSSIMHPKESGEIANFIGILLANPNHEPIPFSANEIVLQIESDSLFEEILGSTFDLLAFKSKLYSKLFPNLLSTFLPQRENVQILLAVCKHLSLEFRRETAELLIQHVNNDEIFAEVVCFFCTFDFPDFNARLLSVIREKFFCVSGVAKRLSILDFFVGINDPFAAVVLKQILADKKRVVRERAAFLLNDLHLRLGF